MFVENQELGVGTSWGEHKSMAFRVHPMSAHATQQPPVLTLEPYFSSFSAATQSKDPLLWMTIKQNRFFAVKKKHIHPHRTPLKSSPNPHRHKPSPGRQHPRGSSCSPLGKRPPSLPSHHHGRKRRPRSYVSPFIMLVVRGTHPSLSRSRPLAPLELRGPPPPPAHQLHLAYEI